MSLADRDLVEEERERQRLRDAVVARDIVRPAAMDDGTRRLAVIAGGLGFLLLVVVGGWSLIGHHRPTGIPVIEPPPGPVRVKPADPGGMQLMSTQVAQTNGPAAQALAPAPEQAEPQALQAEVDAARHAEAAAAPAPPKAAPTKAAGPTPASPTLPPPPPPPPQASDAAAPPAVPPAPDDAAGSADEPAPSPAPQTPPSTSPPAPPGAGARAVQLGALGSDAAARAEWARLSRQAPALFADRAPTIQHVTRGSAQFFRLRTGGFASAADAGAFCARAKAKGIACTLADF